MSTWSASTGAAGGDLVVRVPWWPGMEATVAGEPVEVDAVDGTLTSIPLPGGLADAPVTLSFRPRGEDLLLPLLALGGASVLGAVALAAPVATRSAARRTRSATL